MNFDDVKRVWKRGWLFRFCLFLLLCPRLPRGYALLHFLGPFPWIALFSKLVSLHR